MWKYGSVYTLLIAAVELFKMAKTGGKSMKTVTRVALSVAAVLGYGWVNNLLSMGGTLATGKVAGSQFDASDLSYVGSMAGMQFFSHIGIPAVVLLGVLALIWWTPAKKTWRGIAAALVALMVLLPSYSQAYYDKTDYAEPYFIMPNESAFWVPDVGDNKTSQTKFGSEQYYSENKIAAKRFVIPHTKLDNSGLFSNFYVPAGRLIIVDRTPYSREWVDANDRGTSHVKQGFPCQSKEGMNMTVGMAIGVSVMEENAAKFLYRFGSNPPEGNRTDPNVVFQSVLHSRSLTQVMDTVGRNKVQALVCNEITSRNFDEANRDAAKMMQAVKDNAEKYFASVGITLDYLGWADTISFDDSVQKAINDAYVASKVGPVMGILQSNAENHVKEGLGRGLATKGLPASLVILPQNFDFQKAFSGTPAK